MTYELMFHPDALKEWEKLTKPIKEQFKKVLKKRLVNPHIPSARLHGGLKSCYKIKLKKAGFRLVYQIKDKEFIIIVIAVGKRADDKVYIAAKKR